MDGSKLSSIHFAVSIPANRDSGVKKVTQSYKPMSIGTQACLVYVL